MCETLRIQPKKDVGNCCGSNFSQLEHMSEFWCTLILCVVQHITVLGTYLVRILPARSFLQTLPKKKWRGSSFCSDSGVQRLGWNYITTFRHAQLVSDANLHGHSWPEHKDCSHCGWHMEPHRRAIWKRLIIFLDWVSYWRWEDDFNVYSQFLHQAHLFSTAATRGSHDTLSPSKLTTSLFQNRCKTTSRRPYQSRVGVRSPVGQWTFEAVA